MHWTFVSNLPLGLLTAWMWALLAFLVGRIVHRHASLDVFWGAGFVVVYFESLFVADHSGGLAATNAGASNFDARYFVLGFVALWGLRLAMHLALRQRGAKEDTRYIFIMEGARGRNETLYALRVIYGLQGLLLWFVSIPLQWTAFRTHFDWLIVPGLVLVTIGILFEATGDEQLRAFVGDPTTKGTTLKNGLWRYTRHPNYFGDSIVWCGFYVVACSSGWGFLTILSPIAMMYLLTSHSGKPMLERKLTKTRAGYAGYVATTSSFIPWPPKRTH